jgi:hypothetical protein
MSELELEVANEAVRELRMHGTVKLEYITAGFKPHSRAQPPDIVFWPDSGPNKGCAFFTELRFPANIGRRLPSPETLEEHWQILDPDHSCLFFAMATSRHIDDEIFLAGVSARGIEIIDNIESGRDLALKILRWTETAPTLSKTG